MLFLIAIGVGSEEQVGAVVPLDFHTWYW